MGIIEKIFGTHSEHELKRIYPIVDHIDVLEPEMQKLSDQELKEKTKEFKRRLEEGETLDDLAADYAKTFLGAGSAQGAAAFPYESVYTSPKHVMMQDAWNQMCEILESKGIERNEESKDLLEDHIAVELDYMAYLCDETSQYTETLAGLEEQREFLNKHLLNWVPEVCLDIKDNEETAFERLVGQVTT